MVLFILFGIVAVAGAIGVIVSRKPAYSALFLLLNFVSLAVFYVMLQAQFLAAVQVIVYAGAIVVLFLFVVMLIGDADAGDVARIGASLRERATGTRIAAAVLGILLAGGLVYGLASGKLSAAQGTPALFGQGSVEAIGQVLYTQYLLPFELTSVLLLVGMIGAVVLARKE